jgi:hypothetical protein
MLFDPGYKGIKHLKPKGKFVYHLEQYWEPAFLHGV